MWGSTVVGTTGQHAGEEMFTLRDMLEEFNSVTRTDNCVLSIVTWIFLREACRYLVELVREFI